MSERTEIFDQVYKAAEFFQRTGKHKQVSFRYNPEVRTEFNFSAWKHDRDSDSVRKVLVADVKVSSDGMVYAIGIVYANGIVYAIGIDRIVYAIGIV